MPDHIPAPLAEFESTAMELAQLRAELAVRRVEYERTQRFKRLAFYAAVALVCLSSATLLGFGLALWQGWRW